MSEEMKKSNQDDSPATEQYELQEGPLYQFGMNRRTFFSALGSGVAIAFTISNSLGAALADGSVPESQLGAWIHIGENGRSPFTPGRQR